MFHPQELVNFPDQPDALDLGDRQKRLHSPYRCTWEQNGRTVRLTVPADFVYNGASVPQIVWSIYPPHALDRAAVFHDFIYRHAGVMPPGTHQWLDADTGTWHTVPGAWSRGAADALFFRHLSQDPNGPGWLKRRLAYGAVRAFGRSRWG